MIDALGLYLKYRFIRFYNALIYFFQKIPLIGKIIGDGAYKFVLKLESLIFPLSVLHEIIYSFFKKLLFYLFIIIFCLSFTESIESLGQAFTLELVTAITFAGIFMSGSFFYDYDKENYMFIKDLKVDPKNYYISTYIFDAINYVINFSLVIYLTFTFIGIFSPVQEISILGIASFAIFSYSLRFIYAYFHLKLKHEFSKYGVFKYTYLPAVIVLISFVLLEYVFKVELDFSFLFSPLFALVGMVIFTIIIYLLLKTNDIYQVVYTWQTRANYKLNEVDSASISGVVIDQANYEKDDKDFSNYTGIDYINKIFYYRMNNILSKKKRRKFLIAGLALLLVIGATVYDMVTSNLGLRVTGSEELKYFPYLAFVLTYLFFNGDYFITFTFYNMDRFLIKYSYYRQPKMILRSIFIRTIEMLKYQAIPFILFLIALVFIGLSAGLQVLYLIRVLLMAILGIIFFNIHYLYMYYLIQPFTTDAEVKNPLFRGLTWAIYMLLYFSMTSPYAETILNFAALFVVIYILIGGILVYKFAPVRFKSR